MGSEWPTFRVADVAEVFDGPHATPEKISSGPVFLGISSLESGRLKLEESAHLSEQDYARWTKRVTPGPGDVVFSYETRLGEAASIPRGLRCCLGRRMGLLRPRAGVVDPRFLLYAYLGPEFQETLRKHTIRGSTVERILLTELPNLPIRLPDLAEQRAIASILGVLDDKIDLNRRMSRTLDGIARAIFRGWLCSTTSCGWAKGELGQLVSVVCETVHPGNVDPTTPYVALEHFDGGSTALSRFGVARDAASAKSRFRPGDILFGKLRPYFHNVALAPCSGICSTDVMVIRPRDVEQSALALGYIDSPEFIDVAAARSEGTRMPRAKWGDVSRYPVKIPPDDTLRVLAEAMTPVRARQSALARECQSHISLRDALLPRLMSGDLRPVAAAGPSER